MTRRPAMLVSVLAGLLMLPPGPVQAGLGIDDARPYIGWNDNPRLTSHTGGGVLIGPGCLLADEGVSIGTVCFPADHIQPDSTGRATLTATDRFNSPVSFFVCQDSDGDGFCGETSNGELNATGCASTTVDQVSGWNPGLPLFVLIDGPLWGNPLLGSPCGTLYSGGTMGTVDHT